MNLFVIRSPYCYVNALEWRHHFGIGADECYLLIAFTRKDDIDVEHFRALYNESDWAGMAFYPKNSTAAFFEKYGSVDDRAEPFRKIIALRRYVDDINAKLSSIGTIHNVILQNIEDFSFLHIANKVNSGQIHCLDQGPKSVWTSRLRQKKARNFRGRHYFDLFKRSLMAAFFGYLVWPVKKTTFFSCYELEVANDEVLIKHDYEFLREKAKSLPRVEDVVYFIGSSLSEVGVISEDLYLHYLERIARFFAPKKVVYIAHRGDCASKLEKIGNLLNIQTELFNIPFELQLAAFGPVPSCIASFYSSVLVNCHEMMRGDLPICSFVIPSAHLSDRHRKQVETVYGYYRTYAKTRQTFQLLDIF